MELRSDFIKLITQNIKDYEKREISHIKSFNKIKMNNRSFTEQNLMKEKSFFDLLTSKHGIDELYYWINKKFKYQNIRTEM